MNTKHTPGPWTVRKDAIKFLITAKDNSGIAHTSGLHYDSEANARLIAAAPELLEALIELKAQLLAHVKFDVKRHYSLMVADAAAGTALAKARGEHVS